MRCVAYTRVSTDDQARNGVSLDDQEAKIRAYAELYGHEVVEVVSDPGVSAKSLKRPGAQRLLDMIRHNQVEGVVVAKLDRLTRSVRDLADIIELCNRRSVALISVAEQIDTSTAAGRMVVNMLGVISQWEREVIGERTSAAIQYKKANGQSYPGRQPPYGYAKGPDGRLLPVSEEQETIAIITGLAQTQSVRSICRELEARGCRQRNGRPWHHKLVGRIIAAEKAREAETAAA